MPYHFGDNTHLVHSFLISVSLHFPPMYLIHFIVTTITYVDNKYWTLNCKMALVHLRYAFDRGVVNY